MTNSLSKTDLNEHRQQFPGLINKSYFNFGGQGTMPEAALKAITLTHKYIQQVGPFSGKINSWLTDKVNLLREAIATELGTTAETITLTENVTAGCNIALWGVDWRQGDRILMTDCEHPGIIATVREISRRFGVESKYLFDRGYFKQWRSCRSYPQQFNRQYSAGSFESLTLEYGTGTTSKRNCSGLS